VAIFAFGLVTGPSAFHHVVRRILSSVEATSLLDDIIVAGRDVQEHDSRLKAVLERLVEYGATVRAKKCDLGKAAVDFNGHNCQ
jgi:hypothetical protein